MIFMQGQLVSCGVSGSFRVAAWRCKTVYRTRDLETHQWQNSTNISRVFRPLPRVKSYHLKKDKKTLDMAARKSISRSVPGGWADPALCRAEPTYFELSMVVHGQLKMAKSDRRQSALVFLGTRLWLM